MITKTDFILYTKCPSSFWLKFNKPDIFEKYKGELDDFLKKLIREGYEIEKYAKELFSDIYSYDVCEIESFDNDEESTKKALKDKRKIIYQGFFQTKDLSARIDFLELLEDGTYCLYEAKLSTEVKRSQKTNHIKDLAFQTYVLKSCGLEISKVKIVHTNKNFTLLKNEKIDPSLFLQVEDVTNEVFTSLYKTENEINSAIKLLKIKDIDKNPCNCFRKTRSNHCDTYNYFNEPLQSNSIYNFRMLSEKKLNLLLENGIEKMDLLNPNDIEDLNLSSINNKQLLASKLNKPFIDLENIKKFLSNIKFPIYFLDYEAIQYAVPRVVQTKPFEAIPFQFSLHILDKNGNLKHKEFLSEKLELPYNFVLKLKDCIDEAGTFISWNASYENTMNKNIIIKFPEFQTFLNDVIKNTLDLEIVFKNYYIDSKFNGYTSIKKVLPIMCPELSYEDLEIQDGTMALYGYEKFLQEKDKEKKEQIKKDLLEYCKLDTYAMVGIYKKIKDII